MKHAREPWGGLLVVTICTLSLGCDDRALGTAVADMGSAVHGSANDLSAAVPRDLAVVIDLATTSADLPSLEMSAPDLLIVPPVCGDIAGLEANAAWAMEGGCPTRQGRSAFVGTAQPRLKWSLPNFGAALGTPIIGADGLVFMGSSDGHVSAVDGVSGRLKWISPNIGRVSVSVALSVDGRVVVGGHNAIVSLDRRDGTVQWTFATGGDCSSPTIGGDGTVYASCLNSTLYAIDGATGKQKWAYDDRSRPWTYGFISHGVTPASIGLDGSLYVGAPAKLISFSPANGAIRWSVQTFAVGAAPTIGADGSVYAHSIDNDLSFWYEDKYMPGNGTAIWERGGGAYGAGAAIVGNGLFVTGALGSVIGTDLLTGGARWTLKVDNLDWEPYCLTVGADGTVYFGAAMSLYAVDGSTGRQKWRFNLGVAVPSLCPSIGADGTIYVGSKAGLYAIGP